MKIKVSLPTIFVVVSSIIFLLGAYLLATKTSLNPELFIIACGEVLRDINQHVHFNLNGITSSLVLLVAFIGGSLTLRQLAWFSLAHHKLHQIKTISNIPTNLQWVIDRHNIDKTMVSIVGGGKLTAYTIGLFKPKIVVSELLIRNLTKQQLEAVVLHELHHLENHHVLWLLSSRLLSSLFFFIPLIQYLAQQLKTEFELAADAFVVEKQKTKSHLCDSLALNLQYAGGVIPHFATSPIERRVESLVDNKLSLDQIGAKPLAVSMFSLALMLGIAIVQPNQVTADSTFLTGGVCSTEKNCQTTDCTGLETRDFHNFTPAVPATFLY